MITFKPVQIKLNNEKVMSPYEYDELVKTKVHIILSAKYIPPPLGSKQILGRVWVKFKPGYRHHSN